MDLFCKIFDDWYKHNGREEKQSFRASFHLLEDHNMDTCYRQVVRIFLLLRNKVLNFVHCQQEYYLQ